MVRMTSQAHPEIVDLQAVMRLLKDRLDELIVQVPIRQRPLVPNALLNIAVEQILLAAGASVCAGILQRLADLIQNDERPQGTDGFRLTGYDA
jgi:hypothetical protein